MAAASFGTFAPCLPMPQPTPMDDASLALQLTKASKLHQSSHHKPDLIIHREQNRKTSETVAKIIKATETPTMSGCWPVKAISWKEGQSPRLIGPRVDKKGVEGGQG
ncbi:hypothetical protein N7451_010232 [Penicillium sp. IBT 35674x]|nr:hypothetical protein N7451_010232 [Penicillium sp. IBT 35674x]